ncbi:MAG: glycosyltransferase [Anaerolineales bacterium]|nr:glycosyltransferase [Anaerolineales bacterium]
MTTFKGLQSPTQITAVIATRNRGDSAVVTVESILANTHPDFRLLVIDQSDNSETREALAPFQQDPRFQIVQSSAVGLGRAHNLALTLANSPLVAITDDDCLVPTDWLSKIEAVFQQHEQVAVVYCNVLPGPHDSSQGFIPDYQQDEDRMVKTIWGKIKARGIGAGMAVRREPIVSLGGFDENMGPGAEFPSAGDRDLAIRALLKGWWVYETVSTSVIHFGYRTWAEGRELTRRDWLAMGAMCAKPIKCGYWQTAIFALYESIGYGILQPLAPLFKGKRPQGFRRFVFFWRGFLQGWQTPVARDTLVFLGPVPVALPLAARELEQRPQA